MANEYLKRTPTSTGNRRVWTWSCWYKRSNFTSQATTLFSAATSGDDQGRIAIRSAADGAGLFFDDYTSGASQLEINTSSGMKLRDFSSWMNLIIAIDTTKTTEDNRVKLYVNGVLYAGPLTSEVYTGGINYNTRFNQTILHTIGWLTAGGSGYEFLGELADLFLVDGQALTPDVFGFYKVGKGYVSAGSTQSTDFRPGQWVPKTPRVIKTAINNSGGFGVNGFYLPMNDSNNFGADFHCEPNSIIKLQENLPQPRCRIDGVGDYTGALRDDPFKQYLVLALPFVSGGLQSGFGDYSAAIKGSGSAKAGTVNGSISIASTASYYGSAFYTPGTSNYLSFVDSSDFDIGLSNQPFTWETWFNLTTTSTSTTLGVSRGGGLGGWNGTNGHQYISFYYSADNRLYFQYWTGSTFVSLTSPASIITANQWNHMAVVYDTKSNLTMYVNGVAVAIQASTTFGKPSSSNITRVGVNAASESAAAEYQQDVRLYKGVAKYKGGFDVPRPYTPVGIATWRAVPDSPANNFATMNPLIEARPSSGSNSPSNSTIVTFADGNLNLSNSASSGNAQRMVSFATIGISTGKWYYEEIPSSNSRVGLSKGFQQLNYAGGTLGSGSGLESSVTYGASGAIGLANNAYYNTATTLTPPSYNNTNIIGVSIDASLGENNLTVRFYKDGVSVSTLTGVGATSPVREWFPTKTMESSGSGDQRYFNFGQNPSFSGNTTAGTYTDSNNKGLFKYQPPSGFLALCEDNLPTPAISDPGKHFKTVLYTGNGTAGKSITGVGFQPDFVWIKSRDSITGNNILVDSVRGSMKTLFSEHTLAEYTDRGVYSFNADGFTTGPINGDYSQSGANYVAWCWKAGAGTTSTNTNGSITSVVSVNQEAGFSIVSYTGTGASNATVGHGLGKVPAFGVVKCRDTNSVSNDWRTQHKSLTSGYYIALNSTAAQAQISATSYGSLGTFTSSSTVTLQAGTSDSTTTNESGKRYIMYLWAEIEGFSKFGSYTGNGSFDGPFVYCGFKPAWVMIKSTDASNGWIIMDNARKPINPNGEVLFANDTLIEQTDLNYRYTDFVSNGFKIRAGIGSERNSNGVPYIFVAFAESPFTTANAK